MDVGKVFAQNEILLTGGNGFLGKVVLGLLLDRYPHCKHLHLLVRPHANQSATERFTEETLRSPALISLAEKHGQEFLRQKITVWSGDVGLPNCGLKGAERKQLAVRVSLILNCAGLVEFFPPLDDSFYSNVGGVENLIALAKQFGAKLLHVSTSYVCGSADGLIEETDPILGYYPRRQGPEDQSFIHSEEIRACRERVQEIYDSEVTLGKRGRKAGRARRSKDVAERLAELGRQRAERWGWVNTYTFAKSLGEQLLAADAELEYAIVRPAIIESALRFPFPGWIEGGRTSAPLVLMALGGMKDWPVRKDAPLEVVPVDLVASALLVVSALLLEGRHQPVYQLGTADVNPVSMGALVKLLDAASRTRLQNNGQGWKKSPLSRRGKIRFLSAEDARARRQRQRTRIKRVQSLVSHLEKFLESAHLSGWAYSLRIKELQASFREQTLDQYLPFVLNNRYVFESENIRSALSLLSEKDRTLLPWDPERIDWKHYWVHHQVPGIEKWVQPEVVKDWSFKI